MPEIDFESNDESKKKIDWLGAMAGGVAGAAVGGMLGAAVGDSRDALLGAVIGGVVSFCGRVLTKGQKEVVFPTGRELDLYLNANPLVKKYIQDKVDRGLKVEGNLHFLPNEEFEALCFKHLLNQLIQGLQLPHGKEPIKASNLVDEAREGAKRSNAFQLNLNIYINKDKAEAATLIHESLHFFQERRYAKRIGPNANEGTTEYFTRLICEQHKITRSQKYPLQYECIKKLVLVCSEDKLAEAYFQGNIYALETALDASKGQGTFEMWIYFMNEERFKNANQLL